MTPKEKAEELFTKFNKEALQQLVPLMDRFGRKEVIKQCALVAVEEIIKQNISTPNDYGASWTYWMQVKQEIKNL